jgi:uncharacterized membrane protein
MSANHLIKISDAVIALKTEAGPVKLNQLVNTVAMARPPEALGTGVLFLNPIIGVALDAASGALGGASTTPS